MTILADLKAEAALALFSRKPADYYDPPPTVCEAMLKSDVNVLVASTGMLHCAANMKAMAAGVPCLCLDGGMQPEWLQSGGIGEATRWRCKPSQIGPREHGWFTNLQKRTLQPGKSLNIRIAMTGRRLQ